MKKYFLHKQICLALSACMMAAGCMAASTLQTSAVGGVKAEQSAEAVTMQLMRTEGDVTVSNAKGRAVSIMEKMKLHNGYRTDTEEASYAWINLDDEKLTKMDAVSETEVRKNGKKLEILLKSGKLFFDVEEALTEEETLNIRTSTMTVGIRGTSGWAEVIDSMHSKIYILEGKVECTVSDPVSGEVRSAEISSGETAEFVVYEEKTDGKKCDILVGGYKEEEIGGFILEELAQKSDLCEKIEEASGLKVAEESKKAGERLAADEAKMGTVLANIQAEYMAQATHVSEEPVWVGGGKVGEQFVDASLHDEEQKTADNTPKNEETAAPKKNKTPAENEMTPAPIPTVPTETVPEKPEEKKPEQTTPGGGSSGGNSGGNPGGTSGGNQTSIEGNAWVVDNLNNITAQHIRDKLTDHRNVVMSSTSLTERTVKIGSNLTIGAQETLTLQGLDLEVENVNLSIMGTLEIKNTQTGTNGVGNLKNVGGNIAVLSGGKLVVEGDLENQSVAGRNSYFGVGYHGSQAAQAECIATIQGNVTNNKHINVNEGGHLKFLGQVNDNNGWITVEKGGKLTVKDGNSLKNERELLIKDSGSIMKGNVINATEKTLAAMTSDRVYMGLLSVIGGGRLDGEVTNQGQGPQVAVGGGDIAGGGEIGKIINNSKNGLISIWEGTVKNGIQTSGGGRIYIRQGTGIGNGLTTGAPIAGMEPLNVSIDSEGAQIQGYWTVQEVNGKWKIVESEDPPCDTYQEAVEKVNTKLLILMASKVNDDNP